MSREYYYFAASLPMLEYDGKVPMTSQEFLADCQRLLTAPDYALIAGLLSDGEDGQRSSSATFNAWSQFDHDFRNELVWHRAHSVNKDPLSYLRGQRWSNPQYSELAHRAVKMTNLFEAQSLIDRARWDFLEELQQGHYYDFETIMIYGLKLKILELRAAYHSDKGRRIFKDIRKVEIPEENWSYS